MMGRFLFLNEVRFLLQNAAWPDGEENQQDLDRPDLSILSAVRLGRSSEDQSMSCAFLFPRARLLYAYATGYFTKIGM